MKKEDLIDFLFNKQEENGLFNLKDELLDELNTKMEKYNNQMNTFVNKEPNFINKLLLRILIKKAKITKNEYHRRKNQLYYKNGVVDGMNLIVTLLSFK